MRKGLIHILLLTIVILTFENCKKGTKLYIDTHYPGANPKLFADEIFSKTEMVKCLSVSSDLSEYYFQPSMHNGGARLILCLTGTMENYTIDTIFNTNKFPDYKYCFEPCISHSMDELFCMILDDNKQRDIFKLKKNNTVWSTPVRLGTNINSSWKEAHPSLSENKTLYFHSWDKTPYENNIYYSKFKNGKYSKRIKIIELGKDGDASDPAIAPDESFLIFVSSRETGFGNCDLYISFNKNGKWTNPENLGPDVNSKEIELGPTISPDGRFLFFYRRDKWQDATYSKIYWVDIQEVIKKNNLEGS